MTHQAKLGLEFIIFGRTAPPYSHDECGPLTVMGRCVVAAIVGCLSATHQHHSFPSAIMKGDRWAEYEVSQPCNKCVGG